MRTVFLLLSSILIKFTTSTTLRNLKKGIGAHSNSWEVHLGGGPQQIEYLKHIIASSCDENLAIPFIREKILNQPEICPANDDGTCFAAQYLLERACPLCKPKSTPLKDPLGKDIPDTCEPRDKIGTNTASDLINKVIDTRIKNQQESKAMEIFQTLLERSCAKFKGDRCKTTYQCDWDVKRETCNAEPCSFLPDRTTCENSKHECMFFGGGDKSHNPLPKLGTGLKKGNYELKIGGSGCFASPCRKLRLQEKEADEEKCKNTKFKDKSREYSCVFRKQVKDEISFLSENYGDQGSIGEGCFDKYLNGNKKQENRKNLGKECYKAKPWRLAKRYNKNKCLRPGSCSFCGSGMCCKQGDTSKGCPGGVPSSGAKHKWYCIQDGGRTTKFVY